MTDDRRLQAARRAIAVVRQHADIPVAVQLWDGSVEHLGQGADGQPRICIESPGVLPSLLRWPTLDRLIQHYAQGRIDIAGGTLIDLARPFALDSRVRKRLRQVPKLALVTALTPLMIARGDRPNSALGFQGDAEGANRRKGQNSDFIQFHYDVGNDFYRLFLDPQMQYSCAYFPEGVDTLEEAQIAKLDMICRKLRLAEGEAFLDIGCGWGGLVCHAAKHYRVQATGITLSPLQAEEARARAAREGVADRVEIKVIDYREMRGAFDKIASIGMYEHIGLANIDGYFRKVRSLMRDDGLFLNHAISRGAKVRKVRFAKRPEQRALQKYIFPGGELDDIGHTIAAIEHAKMEVHDVEAWRRHYERTTRIWCERLTARRAEAEALAGAATYRLWVAYLGGCSLAFLRGSARIYQTLVSKSAKGIPPLPPSRRDLYGG
ncbi:MAG: cyclopropane-fatty-acyl-phospholipid synthase family protein [Pseudomonadota bacterium]